MAHHDLQEKLLDYLQDTLALEHLSLKSLDSMIATTTDPLIKELYEKHRAETLQHEVRVRERLKALGEEPSVLAEAGQSVSSFLKGLGDRARADKPGKNARDGYVQEHVEIAAYELLERLATRAGDEETAFLARRNKQDEYNMARRTADLWDRVIDLTLAEAGIDADAAGAPTGAYGAKTDAAERGGTWTGASTEADLGIGYGGDRGRELETGYDRVQGNVPGPGNSDADELRPPTRPIDPAPSTHPAQRPGSGV